MKWNKMGLSPLIVFIAVTFTANPLLAMEGRVDNLKVDGSCTSEQKAVVVDAFRAANLLVRYSEWAVVVRRMIGNHEEFKQSKKYNYNYNRYTGLTFNHERIVDAYTKTFGAFDDTISKTIRYNYSEKTNLPTGANAFCIPAQQKYCASGAIAFIDRDKKPINVIGFCPSFFKTSLTEAKNLKLYKSASQIELYQAGVVLHELMHLKFLHSNPGHDLDYGLDAVLELAKQDPLAAADNPDSYQAFTMLAYGLGEAPKCVLPTSDYCNCGSGEFCR